MMCQPASLWNGCETSPSLSPANCWAMVLPHWSRWNQPMSPPALAVVGSLEFSFASLAKSSCLLTMRLYRSCAFCCACSRSEEHTSELQSHVNLVCRLLLEKKKIRHKSVL